MRLSRPCRLFLKFVIPLFLVIVIYCFQLSSIKTESFKNFFENKSNDSKGIQNLQSQSAASIRYYTNMTHGPLQNHQQDPNPLTLMLGIPKPVYNVWCIFTKVAKNSPMRKKFRIFMDSLLRHSSGNIHFHFIVDNESKIIANKVIEFTTDANNKTVKVKYYDVHKLSAEIEDIVSVMAPNFSSKPGTYYSDALFFLSLGLYRIASSDQNLSVMMDADTKLKVDISNLFDQFNNFGKKALFGLAPELTPVYRHVLYMYRSKNLHTPFGEPDYLNGFPGYNSGVILFNLKRLRESLEYDQIIGQDYIEHLLEKYSFKGHLGDQDFYTLLGMERPELIHKIDCGWNRQLCTWWRDRGYADIFNNYSKCGFKTKIWHGNCNTPIPDD